MSSKDVVEAVALHVRFDQLEDLDVVRLLAGCGGAQCVVHARARAVLTKDATAAAVGDVERSQGYGSRGWCALTQFDR